MGRRATNENLRKTINKLRKNIPDIAIRTSLIVGFPGETEEDFNDLFGFVKDIRFERLGVFTYSREEGTPAYDFTPQVHHKTKESRRNKIMALQNEISREKNSLMVGKEFDVLIEGYNPEENVYVGRLYKDAPDIDGCVFIESNSNILSGTFVKAVITDYGDYDLIGVIKDESAE